MRSDFKKVLTERPRIRLSPNYKAVRCAKRKIGDEDMGRLESMRDLSNRNGYSTIQTDLMGPLYRYLRSRVGMPWDETYSEVCSHLKGRSTTQQHLLDHLLRAVTRNLYAEGGRLYHSNGIEFPARRKWRSEYYVDPRDGTLKAVTDTIRSKHHQASKSAENTDLKTLDGKIYSKIDGIWYQVWTECVQAREYLYSDGEVHIVTRSVQRKRQLATRELRAHGLANDAPH